MALGRPIMLCSIRRINKDRNYNYLTRFGGHKHRKDEKGGQWPPSRFCPAPGAEDLSRHTVSDFADLPLAAPFAPLPFAAALGAVAATFSMRGCRLLSDCR